MHPGPDDPTSLSLVRRVCPIVVGCRVGYLDAKDSVGEPTFEVRGIPADCQVYTDIQQLVRDNQLGAEPPYLSEGFVRVLQQPVRAAVAAFGRQPFQCAGGRGAVIHAGGQRLEVDEELGRYPRPCQEVTVTEPTGGESHPSRIASARSESRGWCSRTFAVVIVGFAQHIQRGPDIAFPPRHHPGFGAVALWDCVGLSSTARTASGNA
jgi:hypothetical protein